MLRIYSRTGISCSIESIKFSRSFSTSNHLSAAVKKKSNSQTGPPKKGSQSLVLKKRQLGKSSNAPAQGERKAYKNRIIISNTNANSEIPGLVELSLSNLVLDNLSGKITSLPGSLVDALRLLGAFKRTQAWSNYSKPSCLWTDEATQISNSINDIRGRFLRKVIYGPKRSGKSVMLLQAISMALLNKWIVISIPESNHIVDGKSDYNPIPKSNPTMYEQNEATFKILQTIAQVNHQVLKNLFMSKTYPDIAIQSTNTKKTSLYDLIQLTKTKPEISWKVFEALWSELNLSNDQESSTEFGKRPPILYCADNISHLFSASKYQRLDDNDKLQPIHCLDLALPRHFIDHMTGKKSFENGGMILGSTSSTNLVKCPALDTGIQMGRSKQISGQNQRLSDHWNALERIDQRVMNLLTDLDVIYLSGITKDQTKSLLEYWAYSGLIREKLEDKWINEKWTMSGGGIFGELERSIVQLKF